MDGFVASTVRGGLRAVGRIPVDLVLVPAGISAGGGVLLSLPPGSPTRAILALPLLVFLPGYGVLCVLCPARSAFQSARRREDAASRSEPALQASARRLALSFGLSLAVLPLVGFGLYLTPSGVTPLSLATVLSGFALLGLGYRLAVRPREEELSLGRALGLAWRGVTGTGTTRSRTMSVVVGLLTVLTVTTLVGAVVIGDSAETYTDLSVLAENESGDTVAGGYPATMTVGESTPLSVGLENHEGERTTYTVVVQLQRVDTGGAGVTVLETERLERVTYTLADGAGIRDTFRVRPEMTGEDLRLGYLLYRGDAPAQPSTETAYRFAYVWVDVRGGDA